MAISLRRGNLRMRRNFDSSRGAIDDFCLRGAVGRQPRLQFRSILLGRHRDYAWLPSDGLFIGRFEVGAGRQRDHFKTIGIRLDDAERAAPNRSGRAEDGDTFHARRKLLFYGK